MVRTMSGGEQQMVAIGRALMSEPDMLLLDEPSLGLSPMLVRELFARSASVRDSGVGMLLVEQNARQSLAIADRGYLIETGRIVGQRQRRRPDVATTAVRRAYLGGIAPAAPHDIPNPPTPPHDPNGGCPAMNQINLLLENQDVRPSTA